MRHIKQKQGLGTCGACAYAAILGLTELQGIRECRTIMKGRGAGTFGHHVIEAFQQRGIKTHLLDYLDAKMHAINYLVPLSTHFPLYLATSERKNGSRHAVAVADGLVYDGHYDAPVPVACYPNVHVHSILIVDQELPTYGTQS